MSDMSDIDSGYLATHPAGDTPARLTLTEDAPGGGDGKETAIVIEATADNYMDLLVALEALNEEGPRLQLTSRWVEAMVGADQLKAIRKETGDPGDDVLTSVVTTCHSPFLSFSAPVVFALDEAGEKSLAIQITVTAPSVFTGMQALKHLTAPLLLESTARSLIPASRADETVG